MDVVKVAFAVLGHLLASVIYVWRRIPISSNASIATSSILHKKDSTKELWENRTMANEQPASSEIICDNHKDKEEFANETSKTAENGKCVMLQEEAETEKECNNILQDKTEKSDVEEPKENKEEREPKQEEVEAIESSVTEEKEAVSTLQNDKIENGVDCDIPNDELIQKNIEREVETEKEGNAQWDTETGNGEALEFSDFSAEINETSEVEQCFKAVATCTLSESNKYHKISEVEYEDHSHLDGNDSLQDASEIQEKDSLEVSIDSDYGEHSEHEEGYLPEESHSDEANHETSGVEMDIEQNHVGVSEVDSCKHQQAQDGEDAAEKYIRTDLQEMDDTLNNLEHCHSPVEKDESNKDRKEKRGPKFRPSTLGVQKTEQPYNTCTTETKIAMEIREMREREEELKLMREKLISPVERSPQNPTSTTPTPCSSTVSPEPVLSGPGYKVSSVFGHKGFHNQPEDDQKFNRSFSKESSVEKEIRLARSREEELRREKGLPPRDDDSYVKPSQVKSSQVRVFGKLNPPNSTKETATAKIQLEIEEQTMREMTLRDTGRIQTISQERTDSKVAKLKDLDIYVPECTSPTLPATTPNGNGILSDHSSKRSTSSPTGSSQGTMAPVSKPPSQGKGISMQRFIASRGKETTFSLPRNGPLHPQSEGADASRSNLARKSAKRTASVESKIQREILEMKLREEELRRVHSTGDQSFLTQGENGTDHEVLTTSPLEYENSPTASENEDACPSHNILIAKWEQRIQKSEGRA